MREGFRGPVPKAFLFGAVVAMVFLVASPGGVVSASSVPNGAITIGTTTAASLATGYDYQGYTCAANNYFWAFYLTGSSWVYESSVDGVSWSSPVTIALTGSTTGGNVAFLCTSSSVTYVSTVYSPSDGNFYWATGTFGAGTITWGGEVSVPTGNSNVGSPSVVTDSSGNLWVAFSTLESGSYHIQVFEHTGGGWTQVQDLANEEYAKLVALSGGKMALLFSLGTSSSVSVETWSGIAWSSPIQTSGFSGSNSLNLERSSATALGDTVEFTFAIGPEGYFLQYAYGSSSWTPLTPTDIGDADYMTIATDGTNNLAITMIDLPGEVYYSISTDAGAHWTPQSAISTNEGFASWVDSSFGFAYGGYDVVWMAQATGSTYNVRFARVLIFNPITIVLTPQNGAPAATFSITGCQVFPTTVPGDGAPHTVYSASSCTMTLSGPADGTTTRYRFAGGASSESIPGCGTGTCPSYSYSYYEQLHETYQAQAQTPSLFDSGLTGPAITGTVGGAATSNVCTISLAGGSSTGNCSGWLDYAQTASFGQISVSQPNTRWQPSGTCSFPDTTGGNTHTCGYYKQASFNAAYCLAPGSTVPSAPVMTYTLLGASSTQTLSLSPSIVWADAGTTASVPATLAGSTGSERWATQTPTVTVTAGLNFCPIYSHQYSEALSYAILGGGSPTAPTFSANQYGTSFSQTLTTSPSSYWFDAGSSWAVTNPLTGSSPGERWTTTQAVTGTISAGQSTIFTYYHQFAINTDYCLATPGSIPTAPGLTYTALGSSGSVVLALSPQVVWADSGTSASVPSTIPGTSPTDRWVTTTTSVLVAAGATFCPAYYHQYQITLGYSVVGFGNPAAPTFVASQTGSPFTRTLSLAPTPYWLDAGASWSVANPLTGSNMYEQWATNQPTSGTLSAGQTLQFTYYHQYALFNENSMGITASNFGSTSTSSSTQQWVDQSSRLTIAGTFAFNTRMPNFAYYVYQGTTGFQILTNTTVTNIIYVNTVPVYAKFDASHCNCSMFIPPSLNVHPVGVTDNGNSIPFNWTTPPGILSWFGSSTFQVLLAANTLSVTATASPTSGSVPLAVQFTGTVNGGTAPYVYSWNFGDGGTSNQQNPTHTYSSNGTYTAVLTVTDSAHNTGQATAQAITVQTVSGLSVTISANPRSGPAPLNVAFTKSVSGGTAPYSYSWNFGDGSTLTTSDPNHTFQSDGTYQVVLTVTDANGKTAQAVTTIVVGNVPNPLVATMTANPNQGPPPLIVQFAGTASGGTPAYTFNWNFGDGTTSTVQNPGHIYPNNGTYSVVLTVTDSAGGRTQVSGTIVVGSGGPAPSPNPFGIPIDFILELVALGLTVFLLVVTIQGGRPKEERQGERRGSGEGAQ